MIDAERIVARPPYPDNPPPTPVGINAESARIIMTESLTRFAQRCPKGFWSVAYISPIQLFSISEKPDGHMPSSYEGHPGYAMEKAKLQSVGLDAMREFGLDTDITDPRKHSLSTHDNGIIRELTVYPSQTVKGLAFERWLDYIGGTQEPVSVEWNAIAQRQAFELSFRPLKRPASEATPSQPTQ